MSKKIGRAGGLKTAETTDVAKPPHERFVAGQVVEGSPVKTRDNDRVMPQQRRIIRKRSLAVAAINVMLQCSKA